MAGQVAARYGKSLISLAKDNKQEDRVYQEMKSILDLVSKNQEFQELIENPIVQAKVKKDIILKVFSNYGDLTKKFLTLLVDKRRENDLTNIAKNYIERYHRLKGMANATVKSAIKLNDDTINKITKYLKGMIGMENIKLENIIDPKVLGGMVIQFEDKVLDLSVANELKEYRKKLIYN